LEPAIRVFLQSGQILELSPDRKNFLKRFVIYRTRKEFALNDDYLSLFFIDDDCIYFLIIWAVCYIVADLI